MTRIYQKSESSSTQKIQSVVPCPLCGGSGWRPIFIRGERRVMRCQHRSYELPAEIRDFKSAAAGER